MFKRAPCGAQVQEIISDSAADPSFLINVNGEQVRTVGARLRKVSSAAAPPAATEQTAEPRMLDDGHDLTPSEQKVRGRQEGKARGGSENGLVVVEGGVGGEEGTQTVGGKRERRSSVAVPRPSSPSNPQPPSPPPASPRPRPRSPHLSSSRYTAPSRHSSFASLPHRLSCEVPSSSSLWLVGASSTLATSRWAIIDRTEFHMDPQLTLPRRLFAQPSTNRSTRWLLIPCSRTAARVMRV